ncbi:MAG: DUF4105 domain-containing protein [Candidatus Sumerlaeia bacterium]
MAPLRRRIPRWIRHARRVAKFAGMALAWAFLAIAGLWAIGALWFDGSRRGWLAGLLVVGFVGLCAGFFHKLRPVRRAACAAFALVAAVIVWWNLIPPRNDRDWQPDVARVAHATIGGDTLTIENVRNFDYRSETDYTGRWEKRTYDLNKLRGVDMFISYWGPALIAHTIASWEFEDGPPLAISIETRKEQGEFYSAIRGLFRQYELYYVVADERDVVRLRTNFRGERVYLYRTRAKPAAARAILLDYLKEVNRMAGTPRWYNALTNNCTTSIRHHVLHVGEGSAWDWRILANGRIDQLGYERGMVDTSMPFPVLRKLSDVTDRAKAAGDAADFSDRIREGLPGRFTEGSS